MQHPLTHANPRPARRKIALRLGLVIFMLAFMSACYGPPPTDYVIITDTPNGSETATFTQTPAVTVIVVTATGQPVGTGVAVVPSLSTQDIQSGTAEVPITDPERTVEQSALFPTPTFNRIYVAEQTFENGRMFWLDPIDQIWVMIQNADDRRSGIWMVFNDAFQEGDQEFDPSIEPPEGFLQPERGFGQLWRENDEIRGALGWATQGEIGHVSDYQYQPSGTVENGEFVSEPGYHILASGYGNKVFRFNEINGTWQTLRDETEPES
jgi:hypothetical protein